MHVVAPMPNLHELVSQRRSLENQIRRRERTLLEPYVGHRVCLTTTFLKPVSGTVEALKTKDLPAGYSKADLYQIVLTDAKWYSLLQDLERIQAHYEEYLTERNLLEAPLREIIISIKQEYGHTISNTEIAKFVGCTPGYAGKFTPDMSDTGVVREQRPRESHVPPALREEIHERDGCCVRCQSKSQLRIHHITPVSSGGDATPENLAVLCTDCHLEAHNGSWNGTLQYDTHGGFWSWATDEPSK